MITAFPNFKPRYLLPVAAAAALGWLWGVSLDPRWLMPVVLMPILWTLPNNRWIAGLVPAVYAMIATRGLISGCVVFFERGLVFALLLWIAAGVPHYLAGVVAWQRGRARRVYLGVPCLCLLLALPPVMLVGWAHPLLAAGLWFPHFGLWALPASLLLMMFIASCFLPVPRFLRLRVVVLLVLISSACAQYRAPQINTTNNYVVHHTAFNVGVHGAPRPDALEMLKRHRQMQASVAQTLAQGRVHVFPESVGGAWDRFIEADWMHFLGHLEADTVVLMGAYREDEKYATGVLVELSAQGARDLYIQRLPMTGGMFNPFDPKRHFSAHWLASSVVNLAGERVGIAICFEHVVLLPMIQTTLAKPNVLIAPASIWWSPVQLQRAQRQSLRLWGLWLRRPIIEVINGSLDA